ncbi:MAG: PEGA domain-containing protein [Candidatus Saccharicenans sp.]
MIFQSGCLTRTSRPQKIPVTSNPAQARISVDGQEIGYTPLMLNLSRDRNHIIKIEKEGYEPALIQVQSKTNANTERFIGGLPITVAGMCVGLVLGFLVSPTHDIDHKYPSFVIGGAVLGAVPGVLIMAIKPAPTLEPGVINIILKRAPEGERGSGSVQTIQLTPEQLSNLRWIRISCE